MVPLDAGAEVWLAAVVVLRVDCGSGASSRRVAKTRSTE